MAWLQGVEEEGLASSRMAFAVQSLASRVRPRRHREKGDEGGSESGRKATSENLRVSSLEPTDSRISMLPKEGFMWPFRFSCAGRGRPIRAWLPEAIRLLGPGRGMLEFVVSDYSM